MMVLDQSARPLPTGAQSKRQRLAAFTIFEVMMAVIVLSMGLVTSVTVMQRAFTSVDTARNLTYAAQIMQSELERMRLLDWTTAQSTYPSTAAPIPIANAGMNSSYIGARFTLTGQSTPMHSGTMLKVTLNVTWKNYDGRTLSRSMVTYYGKNGLYDYFSG